MAAAVVIPVHVGYQDLPKFYPEVVYADVGDIVEFHWMHGTHDVTLSHIDSPCQPYFGDYASFYSGAASGAVKGWDPSIFRVTINSTFLSEMFFYSSVGSDCNKGMVGVINPSHEDMLDIYKQLAVGAKTVSADYSAGGEWAPP
ncbi:hypothetical protein MMYC01_209493, partial [Madurella mycetomatis]